MPFQSKTFKAKYPSKCECGKEWGAGAEVGFHKQEGKKDWVCSDSECGKPKQETPKTPEPGQEKIDAPVLGEEFQKEIDAITKYAEVVKSIGYPPEHWNLSTIWNTERMQRK
jgi:hypothetical protein